MTKASDLIKRATALKEAFPEKEYESLVDKLMTYHGEILYSNGEELKTLYELVGDRGALAKDWKAYEALKKKPQGEFTSSQVQSAYQKQLESDPIYRVQMLEARVRELEERVSKLEDALRNPYPAAYPQAKEQEEREPEWISFTEAQEEQKIEEEEEEKGLDLREFFGMQAREEIQESPPPPKEEKSIREVMEEIESIRGSYGMPEVNLEEEAGTLINSQEFYMPRPQEEEEEGLFLTGMREEEEEEIKIEKEENRIERIEEKKEEERKEVKEEELQVGPLKRKEKKEGDGGSGLPVFTGISLLNFAGLIFQRII